MRIKNFWKPAFWVLLMLNILVIAWLAFILFSPADQQKVPEPQLDDKKFAEFSIQANKADLNKLVNHYIEKEGLNGPIHYDVFLTDVVELYGKVEVFSQSINLKMTFEPEALDNGDLILQQKDVYLGDAKLPVSYILKFIRDGYKLPSWVQIKPGKQQVYIALQEMRLNNGIQVRVEDFDLENDQIALRMLVPSDKNDTGS